MELFYNLAYGAQDIYLTGNPQITFFKAVYKRCTNLGIEVVEENFTNPLQLHQHDGNIHSSNNRTLRCKLKK